MTEGANTGDAGSIPGTRNRLLILAAFALAAVILILAGIIGYTWDRLNDLDAERDQVVETHLLRNELLSGMRDIVRRRAISLREMLIDPDPFVRDEAYQEFMADAQRYVRLRRELRATELTPRLEATLGELDALTREGSTVLNQTAERVYDGGEEWAHDALQGFLAQGRAIQARVIGKLSQIVNFQEEETRAAFERLRVNGEAASETIYTMVVVGKTLVAAIVIITLVQLRRLSNDLERETRRAHAASRAKSAFLANMSHEIRTPLHGVLGMLDLLDGTRQSSDQREFTGTARDSARALLHILNDVLDFSKAEADKLSINPEPFDLRATTERVLDMLSGVALGKGVVLFSYVEPNVAGRVIGDAGRLRQILTNLLGNAIKFTDGGEVWVRIRSLDDASGGGARGRLAISVHDTGMGIAEDKKAALFDAFSQVRDTDETVRGGTGLGLAISRKIARLMGGDLRVDSAVGRGSTFTLEVVMPPEPGHGPRVPRLNGRSVLLLSHHAHFRVWTAHMLRDWGLDTVAVAHPAEAYYRFDQGLRPDVIMMDEDLPGFDAGAFLREVRRRHRGFDPAALFFAASAGSSRSDGVCVRRPVHVDRLLRTLEGLMNGGLTGTDEVGDEHMPSDADSARPGAGVSVLSVDDNPVNRTVLHLLLERLGCNVREAANGLEAVDEFTIHDFDLILMDAYMPEMDGYEATRTIREIEKERGAKPVPIYGISASVLEADRVKSEQAGMNGLVNKPMGSDELSELLLSMDRPVAVAASASPRPASDRRSASGPDIGPNIGEEQAAIARVRSQLGGGWTTAVSGFFEMASNQLQHLRDAASRGDRLAVQDLAHSLKGSAATLGFLRIAAVAGQVEHTGTLELGVSGTLERHLREVREQQIDRASVG
ncbi:MAG: response regulator [Gammaproteobacteria bacterium]